MSYLSSEGSTFPSVGLPALVGSIGGVYTYTASTATYYTNAVPSTIVSQILPAGVYLVNANMFCANSTSSTALTAFYTSILNNGSQVAILSPSGVASNYITYAYCGGSAVVVSDGIHAISVTTTALSSNNVAYQLAVTAVVLFPSVVQITRIA